MKQEKGSGFCSRGLDHARQFLAGDLLASGMQLVMYSLKGTCVQVSLVWPEIELAILSAGSKQQLSAAGLRDCEDFHP
jgi:hypothetical protein